MTTADPADDYLATTLGDFLDAVAAAAPAPGGGAVAAVTVGLAAGLAAMAASLSTRLSDAGRLLAEAQELRARVAPLAQADAAAYADVLAALAIRKEGRDRSAAVRQALSRASDVPLRVAEAGAATARLAERLERDGNPNLRGDAATARLLATAAVRSAATLVDLNLAAAGDNSAAADTPDPRVARARALADEAHTAWLRLPYGKS